MLLPLQNALGPLGRRRVPFGPFGGHATLGDDCIGAWRLHEESGVRVNAANPGTYDLTVSGPVGFVADGKRGNAADFNDNEHAVGTDTPSPMDLFTLSLWVRLIGDLTCGFVALGGSGGWPNGSAGTLYTNTGEQLTGVLGNFVAGDFSLNQRAKTLNDGDWHFCVGRFNRLTGQIDLAIDNNGWDTSMSLTCTAPTLNAPTFVWLHTYYNEGYDSEMVDIDEALLHSRWLSDDEVTDLWNAGDGLFY